MSTMDDPVTGHRRLRPAAQGLGVLAGVDPVWSGGLVCALLDVVLAVEQSQLEAG
jgi:hypothetical protein